MINLIKTYLRRNFAFTETEIRGLFVLIPLVIVLAFSPIVVKHWLSSKEVSTLEDDRLLKEWYTETQPKLDLKSEKSEPVIEPFDPNHNGHLDWINLGYPERIAIRIVNYRLKGGRFHKKEDLLKIYGIDSAMVTSHMPFMVFTSQSDRKNTPNLDSKKSRQKRSQAPKPEIVFAKVNLNRGDTSELRKMEGIGKYWSARIVKYRELLGGFTHAEQIREIYGLEESLADQVLQQSYFEELPLRKISINQDSIKVLSRHPYISYSTAKSIVTYRKQHGDYHEVSELKKIISLSDSVYQRMLPYLKP